MIARKLLLLGGVLAAFAAGGVQAQEVAPNDMLLADLWTQRSVEYRGNALTVFALARIRLDEALADKNWTAAPGEQKGDYQALPPAVVLDVDETLLDNSLYQVWMLKNNQTFSTKTWNQFCADQVSTAIPGAVEFTKYADAKGVKVFYLSNRDVTTEKATRENMERLGFPMGGNVDTFLMQNEKPEWGSAKSVRRAVVTKDYRVLLNIGDNFGDFDDRYRTQRGRARQGLRFRHGLLGQAVADDRQPDLRLVRHRDLRPRLQEATRRAAQGQVGRARSLGRAQVTRQCHPEPCSG